MIDDADSLITSVILATLVGILFGFWQSSGFAGCSIAIFMIFLDHIFYRYIGR